MTWITQFTSFENSSINNLSCWATEKDAYKEACSIILDEIKDIIRDDPSNSPNEWEINDLISKGDYKEAVRQYNDYNSYGRMDVEYYSENNNYSGSLATLDPADFADEDDEDFDSDENDSEVSDVSTNSNVISPTQVVNDHTCLSCGNTRCSKTEKSCWKCGGKL